jgi:hypothetical protein
LQTQASGPGAWDGVSNSKDLGMADKIKIAKINNYILLACCVFLLFVILCLKKESFELMELYHADNRELVIESSHKDALIEKQNRKIAALEKLLFRFL